MPRCPISLDKELHDRFVQRKAGEGRTLTFLIDSAVKQYLDPDRPYLNIPDTDMAVLRRKCVESGRTLNDVVNQIIREGLKGESDATAR